VVHLFAGPYVTVGRERHEVPDGSRQLLAFVALRRHRVERRRAAGALWPFGNEERAAGNLRSALWRLRRAGIDVLIADKGSLMLHPRVTVDVEVVDQWAARLIQGIPSGPDLVLSPFARDALDLLPGWYDDWALLERERIRQRVLHALEALSERLTRAGRHAEAVDAALLAVGADPLRESAQRALIEAHIAEGNLAEANRSFLFYRDLLQRELGVAPSAELSELLRLHQLRSAHRAPPSPARFPAASARPQRVALGLARGVRGRGADDERDRVAGPAHGRYGEVHRPWEPSP
jgi:DNA-binding SARP family transcriptional activator